MRKTILLLALVMACKQTETSNTSTQTETMSTVVTTTSAAAPATTTAVATDTVTTGTTATTATLPTTTTTHAAKKETTKAPATTTTSAPAATATTAPPPVPPPAAPPASTTTAADLTHANVQTGATLYRTRGCTACHGTNGSGDTVMAKKNNIPDLHSAAVQSMSDAELTKVLSEGGRNPVSQSGHKSKHLTSDEETALIAWLRSLK